MQLAKDGETLAGIGPVFRQKFTIKAGNNRYRARQGNHVAEHDQVIIQGIGGSQGGAVGSMSGVKYAVVKVNDISLEMVRTGRKQKATK